MPFALCERLSCKLTSRKVVQIWAKEAGFFLWRTIFMGNCWQYERVSEQWCILATTPTVIELSKVGRWTNRSTWMEKSIADYWSSQSTENGACRNCLLLLWNAISLICQPTATFIFEQHTASWLYSRQIFERSDSKVAARTKIWKVRWLEKYLQGDFTNSALTQMRSLHPVWRVRFPKRWLCLFEEVEWMSNLVYIKGLLEPTSRVINVVHSAKIENKHPMTKLFTCRGHNLWRKASNISFFLSSRSLAMVHAVCTVSSRCQITRSPPYVRRLRPLFFTNICSNKNSSLTFLFFQHNLCKYVGKIE